MTMVMMKVVIVMTVDDNGMMKVVMITVDDNGDDECGDSDVCR